MMMPFSFEKKNTHTQTPPAMKKTRISHPEKQTNKEKKKKKKTNKIVLIEAISL